MKHAQRPRAERAYAVLLRVILGQRCQEEIAAEMQEVFRDLRHRGHGGPRFWYNMLRDAIVTGIHERRRRQPGDARPGTNLADLWTDLRFTGRLIARSPIRSITLIIVLSVGLGSTYGIVTVAWPVLFRPLPFPDVDQLVALDQATHVGEPVRLSLPELRTWTNSNSAYAEAAGYDATTAWVEWSNGREVIEGAEITHDLLDVLGVTPKHGRPFLIEDDQPGAEPVVLLSDGLWRSMFGARSDAVGSTVVLSGISYRVVGIMPHDFHFPIVARFWVPAGRLEEYQDPSNRDLQGVARLRSGVILTGAVEEAKSAGARLSTAYPERDPQLVLRVRSLHAAFVPDETTTAARVLLAGVVLLVILAAADAGHLAFVTMSERTRELRTRAHLGATPRRLHAQLVLEGAVMVALVTVLAVPMGVALRQLLLDYVTTTLPDTIIAAPGPVMLLLLVLVTMVVGAVTVLSPVPGAMLTAFRVGREVESRQRSDRLRRGLLVATQSALALSLLATALIAAQSLRRLTAVDPGFNPDPVVTALVSFPGDEFDDRDVRRNITRRLLDHVASAPSIRSAGLTLRTPVAGDRIEFAVAEADVGNGTSVVSTFNGAAGDYFKTMGIALLEGRTFRRGDSPDNPVAIVSASLARHLWPGQPAVGRAMRVGRSRDQVGPNDSILTVVGVVADIRHEGYTGTDEQLGVYVPYDQFPAYYATLVVAADRARHADAQAWIRDAISAAAPGLVLVRVARLTDHLRESVEQPRFITSLLGCFGGMAILLALAGTAGVASFVVQRRTREIGVRMALGATPQQVAAGVLQWITLAACAGLVPGIVVATVGARLLDSLVVTGAHGQGYGPFALILTTALTLLIGIQVVCAAPAVRAGRIPLATTLRAE